MRFSLRLLLIVICAFGLRAGGLSSQPPTGDDLLVGVSAVRYVEEGHLGPTMWNHPHLRDLLVYLSLAVLGNNIWGLKAVSLLLGTFSVGAVGFTARAMLGNSTAGLAAALFLALDPLHIDYSRQAIQEVYMPLFALGGIGGALSFLERRRPGMLLLSGVSFGLGLASKWYVAFPLVVTMGYLTYRISAEREDERQRKMSLLIFVWVVLSLIPLAVYAATFVPWVKRGYTLLELLRLQKDMALETATHGGYHQYSLELAHKAYLWFVQPAVYADFSFTADKPVVLIGVGNPLVWMLTIPAILFVLYRGLRLRDSHLLYLGMLFWVTYIPFLVTSRPIWAHTAFSVLPFALTAVAYLLVSLGSGRRFGRQLLWVYLLLVMVASVPLYLLATGKGLEIEVLRPFVESFRPSFER